jgi:hypothetical protein
MLKEDMAGSHTYREAAVKHWKATGHHESAAIKA